MTDFDAARANMIESQVRPNGITSSPLIAAMARIPREHFVADDRRCIAYMDGDVPLGRDGSGAARFLMEPMAFARMVQAARVTSSDIVLDVGCATGYSTAVLAQLAQSVVAVEEDADLAARASDILSKLDITNAAVVTGAHAAGCPSEAPFDVIFFNGRVEEVPRALLGQLRQGGRLVAVVGNRDVSPALVYAMSDGKAAARYAFDASVPELPGFKATVESFVF